MSWMEWSLVGLHLDRPATHGLGKGRGSGTQHNCVHPQGAPGHKAAGAGSCEIGGGGGRGREAQAGHQIQVLLGVTWNKSLNDLYLSIY